MKKIGCFVFLLSLLCTISTQAQDTIPLGSNAYITSTVNTTQSQGRGMRRGTFIGRTGLSNWTDMSTVLSVYFHASEAGHFDLALMAQGHSFIKISCNGVSQMVSLDADEMSAIPAGTFTLTAPGYVKVDLQGVSREGENFGRITDFIVSNYNAKLTYIKKGFSDHFGRRGPSVHLNYPMPQEKKVEWFYNEVTVPQSGEVLGSYYMANGFGEGYMGIQYNSEQERRVLFSVWSPFDTQNPQEIPDDQKIKLLKKGEEVHVNEFGGEGSGGQSYLVYPWKAGVTYKFLTHIRPDGNGNTEYTAYFFATDENRWRLIASFSRPKTNTWYTHAHSFLENFSPEKGWLSRSVKYGNQWVRTVDGEWIALTKAQFTHDDTGRNGVRLDYQGGTAEDCFYLKMGGFFNNSTPYSTLFERKNDKSAPQITWEELE